jgi:hypothetical protein
MAKSLTGGLKSLRENSTYELCPAGVCLSFPHKRRVGHTPGFPVKPVGVDELHAAFLDESRTRGRCLVPRTGNPGISLVFARCGIPPMLTAKCIG